MSIVCKNCCHEYSGKFCNMCGQTTDTNPINLHFLLKELRATFVKYDEGFFFTLKQLFTHPGKFIREYLEGKRINRTKPISFVIITAGIYSFLYIYFDISLAPNPAGTEASEIDSVKFNHWIFNHFSLVEVLLLPLFAIASYLSFLKSKYNIFEHIILNCYVFGQRTLVNLLAFPFLIAYNETPALTTISYFTLTINIAIVFWTFSQFFTGQSKFKSFLLTLLTFGVVLLELLIIIYIYILINKN